MKFTKNEAGDYVNDKNNLVIWQTENYKRHGVTRYGITDTTGEVEIPVVHGTNWTRGTLAECKRRVKEMQNELNALDKTEVKNNEPDINKPLPKVEIGPTSTEPIMNSLERIKKYGEIVDKILKEAENTPITPIMHYTNEMKMTEETPAIRAAMKQWRRQKLTPEQLERLKEITKEHANPPTHKETDPWTE